MICSGEAHRFIPFGRQVVSDGARGNSSNGSGGLREMGNQSGDRGLGWLRHQPLHCMFKDFNLHDQRDRWLIRQQPNCAESCEEELYVIDNRVYWSRGVSGPSPQLIRSYTMNSPVLEAIWCDFVLPTDTTHPEWTEADVDKTAYPRSGDSGVGREPTGTLPPGASPASTLPPVTLPAAGIFGKLEDRKYNGGSPVGEKRSETGRGIEVGVDAVKQRCVCIREADRLSVFCEGGRDYICALPFQVKRMWKVENGLLFEREVTEAVTTQHDTLFRRGTPRDLSSTISSAAAVDTSAATTADSRATNSYVDTKLSVLFSLFHPLDELTPVICHTGGSSSSAKVSFVTETTQRVVHTNSESSLVYTYDRQLGLHSIWKLRLATCEEIEMTCAGGGANGTYDGQTTASSVLQSLADVDTPGGGTSQSISQSISQSLSRFTLSSSQSPSFNSPLRSMLERVQSPLIGGPGGMVNRRHSIGIHSPSVSRLLTIKSQSPIGLGINNNNTTSSLLRLQTPSSPIPHRSSLSPLPSLYGSRNPASPHYSEMTGQSFTAEPLNPLLPEICLDHLWIETSPPSRDGAFGAASKVFDSVDMTGQNFTCFYVKHRHQLRCVKREESNDGSQLIYGSITVISALDALPIETQNMLLVLDLSRTVVLCTGIQKMMTVHIPGLPCSISTTAQSAMGGVVEPMGPPVGGAESVGRPMGAGRGGVRVPSTATPRMRPGISSRPASALDARLYEEVALLSPVPTELNESTEIMDSSLLNAGEIEDFHSHSSFTTGTGNTVGISHRDAVVALTDSVQNRFSVELSDGSIYRSTLPQPSSCPIVSACIEGLRQILPRDVALEVLARWYCSYNAPGGHSIGQSEWSIFSAYVFSSVVCQQHHVKQAESVPTWEDSSVEHSMLSSTVNDNSMDQRVTASAVGGGCRSKKKPRLSDDGSNEDWQYILNSQLHACSASELMILGLLPSTSTLSTNPPSEALAMCQLSPSATTVPYSTQTVLSTSANGGVSTIANATTLPHATHKATAAAIPAIATPTAGATGAMKVGGKLGQRTSCAAAKPTASSNASAAATDSTNLLSKHQLSVIFALHLVYEELKLDVILQKSLEGLATLLFKMAKYMGLDMYMDYYSRDYPALFLEHSADEHSASKHIDVNTQSVPAYFSQAPPSIYHWLEDLLMTGVSSSSDPTHLPAPFPCLTAVSVRCQHVITMYALLGNMEQHLNQLIKVISVAGRRHIEPAIKLNSHWSTSANQSEKVILYLAQMEAPLRTRLTNAVMVPLLEAASRCRQSPPYYWPRQAYKLIGREDLAHHCSDTTEAAAAAVDSEAAPAAAGVNYSTAVIPSYTTASTASSRSNLEKDDDDDGIGCCDNEVLKLRFNKDLRVKEVRCMLQSARPVRVALTQRPEISDHVFIEEQEKHLYAMCIRTMALPIGRGMLTLCSHSPLPTEALHIPKLCLTGRAPPRNTTVDLTHIDTPAHMNRWPQFHNGVAAGLRISKSSQIESSWILFNKANSSGSTATAATDGNAALLSKEHAGFLFGQGLNGHLDRLATLNIHDYLVKCHEMTSMALLLGMAANKRSTMDMTTTKLLSIHISALLPPTSTELDVSHTVQVAAVTGIGLVYMGTAHRHIAEILLAEIGRPPGPESENCQDRESYSLAAGLALGFVMLAKGGLDVLGLSDLAIPEQLYHYMIGGHKRQLSVLQRERGGKINQQQQQQQCYQIKEGDYINVNVTGPGATLALGLMFFNTGSTSIANWMLVPDTQSLLDSIRPDHLTLRVIARGLILWDSVKPTDQWINSHLPQIICQYAFNRVKYANDPNCNIDFETVSQAYCSIVAGACMVLGLKYASSCNEQTYSTLFTVIIRLMTVMSKPALVEQSGKTTIENSLIVAVLSLAMVMAGSGDLAVLRICRHLRSRVGPHYPSVVYGSHMAISMAIGLLFLGGGRYALGTSAESIAVMLCAFFPRFPNHSNDNRYHLQALRHLYVLAVEERLILPTDVTSGVSCYVPLRLTYLDGSQTSVTAPCILPELKLLTSVEVTSPRYWPILFSRKSNWILLRKLLSTSGRLYVKLRAGNLPYMDDPKGYKSVVAQSLSKEQTFGKTLQAKDIHSFTNDLVVRSFAQYFCSNINEEHAGEGSVTRLCLQTLSECLAEDKLQMLNILITLHMDVNKLQALLVADDAYAVAGSYLATSLWQLRLLLASCGQLQQLHGIMHQQLGMSPQQLGMSPQQLGMSHQQSGVGVCLVGKELLVMLKSLVTTTLEKWASSASGRLTLSRYLRSGSLIESTARQGLIDSTPRDLTLLSAFLSWHSVPHPRAIAEMGLSGHLSFPVLYRVLRRSASGLPVSSVMALSGALTAANS